MDKNDKYTMELTADQLWTISEALDQYSRMICMQLDEWGLWERMKEIQPSYKEYITLEDIDNFKEDIKTVQHKYTKGVGASWCASDFVKECYHIRKEIEHNNCLEWRKKNDGHWCVHCDGATLTRDLSKITIKKVDKNG